MATIAQPVFRPKPPTPFVKLKIPHAFSLRALAITATFAAANAAVVIVPPNYTTAVGTFADTIQANAGGTTVTVVAGSILTGNAAGSPALSVNASGYTVGNAGTLTGNGAAAGTATSAITTLNNLATGKINSAAAQGISMIGGAGSTINNSGIIEGGDDGVRALANGLIVINVAGGTIQGITGAASDGIQTLDGFTLTNSGTILGTAYGVNAGATANLTNNAASTISGTGRGVSASTGLVLLNKGSILSTAAVGTAGSNAIQATDGTITNTGTITGADRGIRFGGAGTVINSGKISGVVPIDFTGAAANDVLTMTAGTLSLLGTGTNAVNFGTGDDTLNFGAGTITGIVDGGVGTADAINFNGALATDTAWITGNVLAFETIAKTGSGTATITGAITADTINVGGGFLNLNGGVSPSSATIAAINLNSGVLNGNGPVGGWNAAIIQAGGSLSGGGGVNDIGTLTIGTGGATTKLTVNGGNLLVHMNPIAQTNDLVKVTGNASIAAGLAGILISPSSLDAPLQNTTSTVLNVSGIRTGQYAAASLRLSSSATDAGSLVAGTAAGLFTSSTVSILIGNGATVNDTAVTVTHHYDTVAGLDNFGQQFGASLNGRVAESLGNPILADFLGYLDYSSASTVANVMNGYHPVDLQASLAYSVLSAREIHRIVEQQNAGERMVPGGPHVWGNVNYGDYANGGNAGRFTFGAGGTIEALRFGGLVSYAEGDLSGDSTVDSLSYGAYFAMGGSTGWQWNGYLGASHGDTTANRVVAISPTISNTSNFEPDGDGFQGLLSGAYMITRGSWNWGPTFGVEYSSAELDGTLNPGGNLATMSFSADKLESLRSLLGLRAETTWGEKVHPYFSAQWAHEFDGESNGYTATFQGQSFAVNSPYALAADTVILRAGMVIQLGESSFGDLGYLGEYSISDDGNDYSGLNLGVRAAF